MNWKKVVLQIHLWLGLTVGIPIMIIALTGSLYAFQFEIQDFFQPYRFSEYHASNFLTPSEVRTIAARTLPGKVIHSVQYFQTERSLVVTYFSFSPEPYYYLLYLHPTTGKVLNVKNMDHDFFRWVLLGHYYLWLPEAVGKPLVATITFVFLILLLSGFVLWYPRNRAATRQRFSIKLKSTWKRKNFDLHAVVGFYVLAFSLILTITGLIMGFEWFAQFAYQSLGADKELVVFEETHGTRCSIESKRLRSIDEVWRITVAQQFQYGSIELHYPENDSSAIAVSVNPEVGVFYKTDHRYFDQVSLQEIPVHHMYGRYHENASLADNAIRMNYDIHTGAIMGIAGKFAAGISSLLVASLPITGFLIWWGRNKRAKCRKLI